VNTVWHRKKRYVTHIFMIFFNSQPFRPSVALNEILDAFQLENQPTSKAGSKKLAFVIGVCLASKINNEQRSVK
jgi:hypothetical protein